MSSPTQTPSPPRAGHTLDPRIPASKQVRDALRQAADEHVRRWNPTPPQPLSELRQQAATLASEIGAPADQIDFLAILLNNRIWRDTVASIPFHRRLLLLPRCLRPAPQCPATFDAIGLLCQQCGLCSIGDLQREAEQLGYAVLVAEGSAVVMSAIRAGKIDAIIGVSCLAVLEKAFPHMEAGAIPGLAIPLLNDGCVQTTVDLDWIRDSIHLDGSETRAPIDLATLRLQVASWFERDSLDSLLGTPRGHAESVAREWLARSGKRWRPTLTAATYDILRPASAHGAHEPVPDAIRLIAVAVESFHKASLVHDDIEDDDPTRYGEPTLARSHGTAVALNAGDLLIGEGYRLVAEADLPDPLRADLVAIAARGQRELCRGQGAELEWQRHPRPLGSGEVLSIYESKTAPAFDVALQFGARAGGAPQELLQTLSAYSRAIGIAYQIRDDLEDLAADHDPAHHPIRPSLVLALALEHADSDGHRDAILQAWHGTPPPNLADAIARSAAPILARGIMEGYKHEAINLLQQIPDPNLKALLRRVVGKLFDQFQLRGACRDVESIHAQGGQSGQAFPR